MRQPAAAVSPEHGSGRVQIGWSEVEEGGGGRERGDGEMREGEEHEDVDKGFPFILLLSFSREDGLLRKMAKSMKD